MKLARALDRAQGVVQDGGIFVVRERFFKHVAK